MVRFNVITARRVGLLRDLGVIDAIRAAVYGRGLGASAIISRTLNVRRRLQYGHLTGDELTVLMLRITIGRLGLIPVNDRVPLPLRGYLNFDTVILNRRIVVLYR